MQRDDFIHVYIVKRFHSKVSYPSITSHNTFLFLIDRFFICFFVDYVFYCAEDFFGEKL